MYIIKNLICFIKNTLLKTAENKPIPKMIKDVEWEAVKKAIFQKASLFLKKQE